MALRCLESALKKTANNAISRAKAHNTYTKIFLTKIAKNTHLEKNRVAQSCHLSSLADEHPLQMFSAANDILTHVLRDYGGVLRKYFFSLWNRGLKTAKKRLFSNFSWKSLLNRATLAVLARATTDKHFPLLFWVHGPYYGITVGISEKMKCRCVVLYYKNKEHPDHLLIWA